MTSVFVRETAAGDMYSRDLLGTRAVVTGGTRGIGVAFLASDRASWITGSDFAIDGGMRKEI